MRYTLENQLLKVTFDTFGAEIKSVLNKETGVEYIWSGEPSIWNRTAPVLFPFVGALNGKRYIFEGREYPMTSHGFARDSEHEFLSQTADEIWFSLKDTPRTYENFPFHFEFQNGYRLKDNTIEVRWRVMNPGQDREDQNLYFSLGAHPAFACPIHGEENKVGYRIFFGEATKLHHHGNLTGTCTHEDLLLSLEDHRAVITPEFFERSTYIMEDHQTDTIGLETPDGHRFVTMTFDTPVVAVWSPAKKNAAFVCIEPWYGRADYDDYEGDLPHREFGNTLPPTEEFQKSYRIEFT